MMIDKYQVTRNNYEEFAEDLYLLWKGSRNNVKTDVFISMLPVQGKILDVGTGFGKDLIYFMNRGFECIGVDTCRAFIEKAKANHPGCQIIEIDFLSMEFKENEFDGVWARATLFHLTKDDFKKVVSKIRRFLKPNGIFYLQMLEGEFEGFSLITQSTGAAWYSYYTAAELDEILSKNDFSFINEVKIEGWINYYYRLTKS